MTPTKKQIAAALADYLKHPTVSHHSVIIYALTTLSDDGCENCGKTYPHPYCGDNKLPGLIATMAAWRTDEATDAELSNAIDHYLAPTEKQGG